MKYIEIKEVEKGKKSAVSLYPLGHVGEEALACVVTVARYHGQWILCRHKERDTWELPGGHIEPGETPLEAARRELYEETGAVRAELTPISIYRVSRYAMVYFAEVQEIEKLPDAEIGEIRMMDVLPANLTYPDIHPALFDKVQTWLNLQSGGDERWDVYDENRNLTGRTHRRADPMADGDYHLSVHVWIQNSRGEFLNTKRSPNKGYPNMWENTGGSAVAGDDSLTAALREVREETGLIPDPAKGECILTMKGRNYFADVWCFKQDFDLKDVVFQEGETCDVRWATREQIEADMKAGLFVPVLQFETIMDIICGQDARKD